MRGISRHPEEPAWAPAGRWDWTVAVSFIGTVLISAGMLFPNIVSGQGRRAMCVADGARLHRMMGPAAWHAVDHCAMPPGTRAF